MNNSKIFDQSLAHDLKLARIRAREKIEQEKAKDRREKRDKVLPDGK